MRLFLLLLLLGLAGCVPAGERSPSRTETPAPPTEENPKPVVERQALERRIHDLINEQRAAHGLEPVAWDDQILPIARKHSADMATRDYFSHTNPDGLGPADRGYEVGYYCRKDYERHYTQGLAENIFMCHLYSQIRVFHYGNGTTRRIHDWRSLEDIARLVVDGWMDSPGHRKNILNPNYDREAIGIVITDEDEVYITQNFC